MLKIKDNVDIRELEKFGFYHHFKDYVYSRDIISGDTLYINIHDKSIPTHFPTNIDILYDLIQAGLVEKVEEQNDK